MPRTHFLFAASQSKGDKLTGTKLPQANDHGLSRATRANGALRTEFFYAFSAANCLLSSSASVASDAYCALPVAAGAALVFAAEDVFLFCLIAGAGFLGRIAPVLAASNSSAVKKVS